MKRLLNIELKKLLPYTTFWVLLGIHFLLYVLVLIIINSFEINIAGFELPNLIEFPLVWRVIPWVASWFNMFLAIIIIAYAGNEFIFKTFRQHIIDGLARHNLVTGKLAVIIIISVYSCVMVFISCLLLGVFSTSNVSFTTIFNNSYIVFIYFVQAIAYMSFGLMIVLLIRNIALSILIFILYKFPFEPIIRGFLPDDIIRFFPMKVISNLTPSPAENILKMGIQTNIHYGTGSQPMMNMPAQMQMHVDLPIYINVILAIGYIGLFLGISYYIIKKTRL